jgi:hypothetical protein
VEPEKNTMKYTRNPTPGLRRLAIVMGLALLAGCGAGAGEEEDAPPADMAAYTETLAFCEATEPTGSTAQYGGWSLASPSKYGNPTYDASVLVSPRGADLTVMLHMKVGVHDYRTVNGPFIPAAYMEPEWGMGVQLQGRLPAGAACVRSLAKLTPPPNIPGLPTYGYTLNWTSKWSAAVPVAGVPGAVIDGFEFVSSFAVPDAQPFFILSKTRLASTQGAAICHLAPGAANWDCKAPSVTDMGKDWGLERQGAQAGVYVLAAPR